MNPVQPRDGALEPCDAPPIDATFIILLDRDEKRRENAHVTLGRVGHDVEIFHAVDGLSLTSADVERLIRQGYVGADCAKRLKRGQIACALSHIRVLEEVVTRRCRNALVLEDDFDLAEGFAEKLHDSLRAVPREFDVIYLYDANLVNSLALPGLPGMRKSAHPLGTVGYAVSDRGARKILDLITPITHHLDEMLAVHVDRGEIQAYSVSPSLVTFRDGFESQVDFSGYLEREDP
jgi:glycosyl transferase family 25